MVNFANQPHCQRANGVWQALARRITGSLSRSERSDEEKYHNPCCEIKS
jgi:hypothetical protein